VRATFQIPFMRDKKEEKLSARGNPAYRGARVVTSERTTEEESARGIPLLFSCLYITGNVSGLGFSEKQSRSRLSTGLDKNRKTGSTQPRRHSRLLPFPSPRLTRKRKPNPYFAPHFPMPSSIPRRHCSRTATAKTCTLRVPFWFTRWYTSISPEPTSDRSAPSNVAGKAN
jgi:hypothetical protein